MPLAIFWPISMGPLQCPGATAQRTRGESSHRCPWRFSGQSRWGRCNAHNARRRPRRRGCKRRIVGQVVAGRGSTRMFRSGSMRRRLWVVLSPPVGPIGNMSKWYVGACSPASSAGVAAAAGSGAGAFAFASLRGRAVCTGAHINQRLVIDVRLLRLGHVGDGNAAERGLVSSGRGGRGGAATGCGEPQLRPAERRAAAGLPAGDLPFPIAATPDGASVP